MRRIAFNTFAVLSLLLCIFLLYSCLRSFFPSQMRFESVDGSLMILSWQGVIPSEPQYDVFNPASDRQFYGIRALMRNMTVKSDTRMLGFRHVTGGGIFHGMTYDIIGIPYWVLIPPTAILPIFWFRSRRRQRDRLKFGHCLACGYDLRESKDKCPECGTGVKPVVS